MGKTQKYMQFLKTPPPDPDTDYEFIEGVKYIITSEDNDNYYHHDEDKTNKEIKIGFSKLLEDELFTVSDIKRPNNRDRNST